MSAVKKIRLILERDRDKIWGRFVIHNNLIVDSASNIQLLEKKLRKLILEVEELDRIEFDHVYDLTVFFEKYNYLNQSKIAVLSGLNPSLVRQYATGHKQPSWEQVQKIEQAINTLGKSLQKVRLSSKLMVKDR